MHTEITLSIILKSLDTDYFTLKDKYKEQVF
jgi:hypothetical protein